MSVTQRERVQSFPKPEPPPEDKMRALLGQLVKCLGSGEEDEPFLTVRVHSPAHLEIVSSFVRRSQETQNADQKRRMALIAMLIAGLPFEPASFDMGELDMALMVASQYVAREIKLGREGLRAVADDLDGTSNALDKLSSDGAQSAVSPGGRAPG
jgi:hypothetical protein